MKLFIFAVSAVVVAAPLNFPHSPDYFASNTFFLASSGSPKTLDPAKNYSAEGNTFISQVAEPPLAYSYYDRPYKLEPLAARAMPSVSFYDSLGNQLPDDVAQSKIYETHYDIYLRSDLYYGPHPAFLGLKRQAVAADFVYAIKRLASTKVNSSIYSLMAAKIYGMKEFNQQLKQALVKNPELNKDEVFWDLRQYDLAGVKSLGPDHLQIITKGFYRPFIFWLAMNFFAPMPYEIDQYYSQANLPEGLGHDWQPVGTGPYMLTENDPNSRIVLERNPNFHEEYFPDSKNADDIANGYTKLAGRRLPMVDRFVFSLEKESVSSWNKFLQGYYDSTGVSSDNFDQVVALSQQGDVGLSPEMQAKGIKLTMSTSPTIFFMGFNMLDPVVGGFSERARLLRQAISIAIDQEEFIAIFLNGRGMAAKGPIPPDIFGGADTNNQYVYDGQKRKSVAKAQALMTQAGYKNGIDPKTNKPLALRFDTVAAGGADDKSMLNWYRAQFNKIGINLNVDSTQYNRFQDKMRNGQAQIFKWGWSADYPDPENFLFLFYGPKGKVKHNGENSANYDSPEFNKCFEQMRDLDNTSNRQQLVNKCVTILQKDAPWVFGFFPKSFALTHSWQSSRKTNPMLHNSLKYVDLDYKLRQKQQVAWNQANYEYLFYIVGFIAALAFVMIFSYRQKNRARPTNFE